MERQLFKRISEPIVFRKTILESSKEIIENLKTQQRILDIRKKRSDLSKELKLIFKEINLILDKIADTMPAELINEYTQEVNKKKAVQAKSKKGKSKKEVKKPIEVSELTKLESKLSEIERKLQTLG